MQIHELNSKSPGASDVLAMDDGSDTFKTTAANLVPSYTSGDSDSPTSWTSVSTLTSGLSLSTLLNRISTMVKNVRWLYSNMTNCVVLKSYTYDYSISASSNITITGDQMGMATPTGYRVTSIRYFATGNNNVFASVISHGSTNASAVLRNTSSSAVTGTLVIGFVYVRTNMINVIS